jgi:hypothetical protein
MVHTLDPVMMIAIEVMVGEAPLQQRRNVS